MDIDIDFRSDFDPLDYFDTAIRASKVDEKKQTLIKHPAGVYFQNIAVDPITNLAAIPFKEAEDAGYFKVDFLHLTFLDYFESKDEIQTLLKKEPDWFLLESAVNVQKLSHIHRHYDLVNKVSPKSVEDLADILALIRPSKRHFIDFYLKDRDTIRPELYKKPNEGGYYFKKGHSLAYALNIVLQMHLLKAGII